MLVSEVLGSTEEKISIILLDKLALEDSNSGTSTMLKQGIASSQNVKVAPFSRETVCIFRTYLTKMSSIS